MLHRSIRDTVLLCGWLFSDLLLGLMMIFLVSMQPPPPPKLLVTPLSLDQKSHYCSGGPRVFQCTIVLGAAAQSLGKVAWSASTDIGSAVTFTPSSGTLSSGSSVSVTIASIPCQNGAFTFSGQKGVFPIAVSWLCTPPPLILQYQQFNLSVNDPDALIHGSPSAVQDIKRQIMEQPVLQGRKVGLVIVYGSTLTQDGIPHAQQISTAIYQVLGELDQEGFVPLKGAVHYDPLYLLGKNDDLAVVQVYLFEQ